MFRHAENAFYDRERATLNILITLQLIATKERKMEARQSERERERKREREREKERKRENDIYYISYKF